MEAALKARTEALAKFREAQRAEDAAWQHHCATRTRDSELAHREAEGARRRADLDYQGAVEAVQVAADRRHRQSRSTTDVQALLSAHRLDATDKNVSRVARAISAEPLHSTIAESVRWVCEVACG